MKTIPLWDAFYRTIVLEHKKPFIHDYELTKYLVKLYTSKQFDGVRIGKISKDTPTTQIIEGNIYKLIQMRLLEEVDDLPIYKITSHSNVSAAQAMCTLNPFCYLSHLSAMEFHGITDRLPHVLHVTTVSAQHFRKLAKEQSHQDFGGTTSELNVMYRHWKLETKLFDKKVYEHSSKSYRNISEKVGTGGIRVSPVGKTFFDMLRRPQWCGGIRHVLDVFDEYAKEYLPTIIKTTDKEGSNIDKARMGYVLEERFHLATNHPVVNGWKNGVQRGGSRLLVAGQPYLPKYSNTWLISINLPNGN